ncbi:MAG: muramidase [Chitinophagaceae bacterium]|nr:MAG: muramidase [Chitinophagaceae bacterium]
MLKTNSIENTRTRRLPVRVMTTLCCVLFVLAASAQSKYVKKYRPLADSLASVYGIPSSIILGVAILESGSGTSRNARNLNNHFGIVGRNNLLKTKGIRTRYKQYPNVAASYADFCGVLSRKKYYSRLKGTKDTKTWIDAIARGGYSEAPVEWKKRINATIRKNKLATH